MNNCTIKLLTLTDFAVVTSPIWWTDAVVRPINVVTSSTKLTGADQSLTFINVCKNKKHQINVHFVIKVYTSRVQVFHLLMTNV